MNQNKPINGWREIGHWLAALLLLGQLWTATPAHAQSLHLLVFADTEDPGLSSPNIANTAYLQTLAQEICTNLKLANKMVVYKGPAFEAANCDQVLADFGPGPDDIVFFYFMGHGWNNTQTDTPMLLFRAKGQSPSAVNSRNLSGIFEKLQKKGARLTLAFAESCNSALNDRSRARGITSRIANASDVSTEQLRNLFLRSQMSVLLHACKRGQKSNSSEDGGWFFGSFLESYRYAVSTRNPEPASWEALLTNSARATADYAVEQGTVQEPVFHIYGKPMANTPALVLKSGKALKAAGSVPVQPDPATGVAGEKTGADVDGLGDVCALNRVAFNVLLEEQAWLNQYYERIQELSKAEAVEQFQKHYDEPHRLFFQQLVQRLNAGGLAATQQKQLIQNGQDIADILDEIADNVKKPDFKMTSRSKLATPIDTIGAIIEQVRGLQRRCPTADR